MRRHFLVGSIAFLMVAPIVAAPAAAAPWVRGYVVNAYEPAFFYGGKIGTEQPGSDCPKGTNPDNDYKVMLKTKWLTEAQIEEMTKPLESGTGDGAAGRPGHDRDFSQAISHRGFRKDIETYINPFAAPDPGLQEVTGKIAEGFDLDNNAKTGGFTSPSGERGIDNAYYKVFGCTMSYRGMDYQSFMGERATDKMNDGLYTFFVRVSGKQDPMNDNEAIVEIGYSPDHLVRDANSNIAAGYSFRAIETTQYTKLKARIKNGAVETEQVAALHLPEFSWCETNRGDVLFQKGRVRLTMKPDGTLTGLVGGYADWRKLYADDTFNYPSGGQTRETFYHEDQIALYYGLKREADGVRDPKTGENTAISIAYRFTAVPAYVVDPAKPAAVNEPRVADAPNIDRQRELFYKAVATRTISAEPRRRGGYGSDGTAIARDGGDGDKAPAAPVGGQQVNNAVPATVVSAASIATR